MISTVDDFLVNGCMRCKLGGTPQCKVLKWVKELKLLREIVLETELNEEIKWGFPVYTHKGKNIVVITALKDSTHIGFFKGVLLADEHKILQQQGNIQSNRIIKFTTISEIEKLREVLKAYIKEAVIIEESGKKVEFERNPDPIPNELIEAFENDFLFKEAFYNLTPGRQRGYIIYFSKPKQSKTRIERIQKYKKQIFNGVGLHDKV